MQKDTPMFIAKDIHYYLSLPYTIEIIREDDETWFARVKELPGCMTEGDSAQDAAEMILDAMAGWIEIALEDGQTIPEPRPVEDYSGKFVVRVPKSLHRDLAQEAEIQGVSLNFLISTELARAVGRTVGENEERSTPSHRWETEDGYFAALCGELSQIAAAIENRDHVGAQGWIEQRLMKLRQEAQAGQRRVALIALLELLHERIDQVRRLEANLVDTQLLQRRVSQYAMRSNNVSAEFVMREETAVYSVPLRQPMPFSQDNYRW